jgi:hypothetical protein
MKSLLNGTTSDDRYIFLRDLLAYTQGGVCNWECKVAPEKEEPVEWYRTTTPGKKGIQISCKVSKSPDNLKRDPLYGPTLLRVHHPSGSFLTFDSVADRLVFAKAKQLLEMISLKEIVSKEPEGPRLSDVVSNLFQEAVCSCPPRASIRPLTGNPSDPKRNSDNNSILIGRPIVDTCKECGKVNPLSIQRLREHYAE